LIIGTFHSDILGNLVLTGIQQVKE